MDRRSSLADMVEDGVLDLDPPDDTDMDAMLYVIDIINADYDM